MIGYFKKVLVLCPHPDDEIGCAGTIRRLVENQIHIKIIFFSRGSFSNSNTDRANEAKESMTELGVEYYEIWQFRIRNFFKDRQEILENLVSQRNLYQPDLVLLPCAGDMHQDHEVVHKEGLRAFKHCNIWGYEMPQNLLKFKNTAFVQVIESDLKVKINAIKKHFSQIGKPYMTPDFIKSLATIRGMQAGVQYAEAFEVIRLVLK